MPADLLRRRLEKLESALAERAPRPPTYIHRVAGEPTGSDHREARRLADERGCGRVLVVSVYDASLLRPPEVVAHADENPLLIRLRALPEHERANAITSWILSRQIDAAEAEALRTKLREIAVN